MMGDGVPKRLPTSFSPVTSVYVRTSPQNFQNLVLTFGVKFKGTSPKLVNFSQDNPSKNMFFSGQIFIKLKL